MSPGAGRARPPARVAGRARRALGDARAAPDLRWVERLTGVASDAIESVVSELDDLVSVEEEIRAAHRAAGRTFYAQIRAPFELYAIVRLTRPRHVVEAGVSSGVSSAHFLLALQRNQRGTLHSIDFPTFQRGPVLGARESGVSIPPGRSSGWAVPDRLKARWDLRIGRSQDLLPNLVEELGRVDVFLHDDLHTPAHLAFELATIAPALRPGSIVLADNTFWTGQSFPRFARRLGAEWYRRRGSDLVGLPVPSSSHPVRGHHLT